jgi:hypothetical protein
LLVAFFVEVGLLLLVLPWSTFWETNYFASLWPPLLPWITNDYVRGGVSGIGVINLCAGMLELVGVFALRDARAQGVIDDVPGGYTRTPERLVDRIEP